MSTDQHVVPAIRQALSMLGQAREALLFAQCPAAVAKVRQAIKSTESALRAAKGRCDPSGGLFRRRIQWRGPMLSAGDR